MKVFAFISDNDKHPSYDKRPSDATCEDCLFNYDFYIYHINMTNHFVLFFFTGAAI